MKIYIASSFKNAAEVRDLAARMKAVGLEPLCAWARTKFAHAGQILPDTVEESTEEAYRDLDEIEAANAVVFLNNGVPSTTGGMHFEVGYAYAMEKELIILGPRSSVFHHLKGVRQFDTVNDFLEAYGLDRS